MSVAWRLRWLSSSFLVVYLPSLPLHISIAILRQQHQTAVCALIRMRVPQYKCINTGGCALAWLQRLSTEPRRALGLAQFLSKGGYATSTTQVTRPSTLFYYETRGPRYMHPMESRAQYTCFRGCWITKLDSGSGLRLARATRSGSARASEHNPMFKILPNDVDR